MIRFIVIAFLFTSCGVFNPELRAYKKIKRNWSRIEETLKEFPQLADSIKTQKSDPVNTTGVDDSLVYETIVDSTAVDSLASLLIEAKAKRDTVLITEIRYRLSTASCPEVKKDTVYFITVYNSKDSVDIPIRLKVTAKGNKLSVTLDAPPTQLPQKFKAIEVNFPAPEKKFYQVSWFWISCVLAILLCLFVLKALTK